MADIDLKTATPDTSLPTTGFLFGADSQASASPSVYSTQTVATTLLGSTSLTGATITTSQPVLDLAQTWNAGAVTFTGLKFNATDTASAAASLLMDLQVGGSSRFNVNKTGAVNALADGSAAAPSLRLGATVVHGFYLTGGSSIGLSIAGAPTFQFSSITQGVGFRLLSNDLGIGFGSVATSDLFLTRRAAANLRLGAADAAGSAISISSVASNQLTLASNHGLSNGAAVIITGTTAPAGASLNTLYYARSISAAVIELYSSYDQATATSGTTGRISVTTAGTSAFISLSTPFQSFGVQDFTGTDIPGQPFIIRGSRGTGTGPGGSIIFQAAPAGTTGTAQNSLVEFLRIDSGIRGIVFPVNPSLSGTGGAFSTAEGSRGIQWRSTTTGSGFQLSNCGLEMADTNYATISFGNASASSTPVLTYDASSTLGLRRGASAQRFNVYNTYTSSTNYEAFKIDWITTANTVLVGTEKGSGGGTARAMAFQTDGVTALTINTDRSLTLTGAGTATISNAAVVGANNSLVLTGSGYVAAETPSFAILSSGTRAFWIERTTGQHMVSGFTLGWSSSATNAAVADDTILSREAAGVTGVRGANTTTGGALGFIEQTAPAAPAANGVRIYAEDNGSGKTRLMALFNTGAAQQIAIEP